MRTSILDCKSVLAVVSDVVLVVPVVPVVPMSYRCHSERLKRLVAGWEDSSFPPDGEASPGLASLRFAAGREAFRTFFMNLQHR